MKKGLNAVCYENEIYIFFERAASLKESDFYEIVLSNGESIKTRNTNAYFNGLKENTCYEVTLYLCMNGNKTLIDKTAFKTIEPLPRLDVTEYPYNAIGDGKTMNTKALQKAIDEANGRVVYIPKGTYVTGALTLHSDTELLLDDAAVIQGSDNPDDYLPLIPSRSEGFHMLCYQALLNVGEINSEGACNTCHIRIRGGSIIGGGITLLDRIEYSAIEFTGDYIKSLNKDDYPDFARKVRSVNGRLRSRLIEMRNTEDIVISNVKLGRGPFWNLHFIYCNDVIVHHCNINTRGIHNGDGVNPDSTTNMTVFDCIFDTGDNCIAIKSGRNPEGNVVNRPSKHIRIFDVKCLGGGIAVGSELSGGCEDIVAWNLDLSKSGLGFGIKTNKKRGGYAKNIHVYDSIMPNIRLTTAYLCNKDEIGANTLTSIENISYNNCILTGQAYKFIYHEEDESIDKYEIKPIPTFTVVGFEEEQTFKNISFKEIKLKKKDSGERHIFEIDHIPDVDFGSIKTIE